MQITRKGVPTEIVGTQPTLGEQAPNFTLPNTNGTSTTLTDLKGQKVLLSVFPDINTRVCDLQTRNFFRLASELTDTVIVNISNNTLDALTDWCAVASVDALMLSDTNLSFAQSYGLYMPEFDKLARSIFVLDENGKIIYTEIVPDMAQEPDYASAIQATK